jgi:hypothetical protein
VSGRNEKYIKEKKAASCSEKHTTFAAGFEKQISKNTK